MKRLEFLFNNMNTCFQATKTEEKKSPGKKKLPQKNNSAQNNHLQFHHDLKNMVRS